MTSSSRDTSLCSHFDGSLADRKDELAPPGALDKQPSAWKVVSTDRCRRLACKDGTFRSSPGIERPLPGVLRLLAAGLCVAAMISTSLEARAQTGRGDAEVFVEFDPDDERSTVILRSDRRARHSLVEEEPDRLVFEIANAKVRSRNDLNPLVTEFFRSAVKEIRLEPDRRHGTSYLRLVIELKTAARHQVEEQDNDIVVSFDVPDDVREGAGDPAQDSAG